MESLYKEIAEKWLGTVNSKINEKAEAADYWFKSKLRPSFSSDMNFSSISGTSQNVTADVVTMDSDLPLKSRASIKSYSGEIPKLGMKKYLGERQLKELQVLAATGKPEALLASKIFDDYNACAIGSQEKVEFMFRQALSTGVTEIGDDINTGRSIRVDFGIPAANKSGVPVLWSTAATSTPIDDIEAKVTAALNEGVTLGSIVMDQATFNNFKKSTQVRDYYAAFGGVGSLNPERVGEFLLADFGLRLTIENRSFKVEKDGAITSVKAWAAGQVSFFTSFDNVGDLVWSDLAEKEAVVEGKVYSYPEAWLMLTKYREGSPLREFTESQGLVMPVINNVDEIFLLDTATVEA